MEINFSGSFAASEHQEIKPEVSSCQEEISSPAKDKKKLKGTWLRSSSQPTNQKSTTSLTEKLGSLQNVK
jgi:hypothetical protein